MRNVILFGDSLFGQFGRKPIQALERAVPGILVYNCAAGGLNSADSLERAPLISMMKADVVCISLGANDCYEGTDKFVSLQDFAKNMFSIIDIFADSRVIIFPCPPALDPNEPRETRRYNDALDKYNALLAHIASERKLPIIDSKKAFGNHDYHKEDGLHLNDLGYQILVSELATLIR